MKSSMILATWVLAMPSSLFCIPVAQAAEDCTRHLYSPTNPLTLANLKKVLGRFSDQWIAVDPGLEHDLPQNLWFRVTERKTEASVLNPFAKVTLDSRALVNDVDAMLGGKPVKNFVGSFLKNYVRSERATLALSVEAQSRMSSSPGTNYYYFFRDTNAEEQTLETSPGYYHVENSIVTHDEVIIHDARFAAGELVATFTHTFRLTSPDALTLTTEIERAGEDRVIRSQVYRRRIPRFE
jgi:hypothetical protein